MYRINVAVPRILAARKGYIHHCAIEVQDKLGAEVIFEEMTGFYPDAKVTVSRVETAGRDVTEEFKSNV